MLQLISGPDPECDKKCANGGWCNHDKMCLCQEGYMGQYCKTALCYPQCVNNGTCTAPGTCTCPPGFQGRHCEGGKPLMYLLNERLVEKGLLVYIQKKKRFPVFVGVKLTQSVKNFPAVPIILIMSVPLLYLTENVHLFQVFAPRNVKMVENVSRKIPVNVRKDIMDCVVNFVSHFLPSHCLFIKYY